ncbi:MAG: cytochrome c oxidase subunit II [Bacteroidota bacterium]|nr:cytochrome c oxidase subunit II [Bacteroidota bacterium]
MKLLVLLAIVLLIIAGHQLLRIIELSRGLKKTTEWQVTSSDNDRMGKIMLVFMILFFAFFFWQAARWNERALPLASSEHGLKIDALWDANMYLVVFIFLVTNFFLFWFAYKYRGLTNTKAVFISHNNKLELAWTVIPAFALAFIIIFGLKYWNEIMSESDKADKIIVELYAKQFDWTARYAGKDGKLGETDYRQISGSNSVGMDTADVLGNDDVIVKNEFHIPIGKEIVFYMRSRDVLHSAYMPHFRAQMNCVPGMITTFKFIPNKTTMEMRKDPYVKHMMAGINKQREKFGEEPVEFDYLLLCNKICGTSHFNMQMNLIVESQTDYDAWIAKQKAFKTVAVKP